jgi:hypothetical protein
MRKITLAEKGIKLNGLPWYEHNGGQMCRLPYELKNQVSEELWDLATQTAGARIRFLSDTTILGMDVEYAYLDTGFNFSPIGRYGINLYVDGRYWSTIHPYKEMHIESMFFEKQERKLRSFTMYLPNYSCLKINNIILDENAIILPPEDFDVSKPVVFYGTSITQGGCASHSGLSYEAILCRELNIDFINLGFSGNGRGEKCIAEAIAGLDSACFVLDFSQNNESPAELEQVYYPFIYEIRQVKRDAPIILITPYFSAGELWNDYYINKYKGMREVIRRAYARCIREGDENIYIVEGLELIGTNDGDCFVDGGHPNDLGFKKIADGLKYRLKNILKL